MSFRSFGWLAPLVLGTWLCTAQSESPQQSQLRGCRANLKGLATALELYAADYPGEPGPPLSRLVPGYLKNLPTCPAARSDTYSQVEWAGTQFTLCCRGSHHAALQVPSDRPAFSSASGDITGLPPSPAEKILARHQQVLDQKRAVANRIAAEQDAFQPLLEAYRKTKSKNLPEEALIELVNQGVATTPPERFPILTTPPLSPEERKILESELAPEGTSYLKSLEEIDRRFPDAEFVAYCQSNQFMLRRNRWLRSKIGKLQAAPL